MHDLKRRPRGQKRAMPRLMRSKQERLCLALLGLMILRALRSLFGSPAMRGRRMLGVRVVFLNPINRPRRQTHLHARLVTRPNGLFGAPITPNSTVRIAIRVCLCARLQSVDRIHGTASGAVVGFWRQARASCARVAGSALVIRMKKLLFGRLGSENGRAASLTTLATLVVSTKGCAKAAHQYAILVSSTICPPSFPSHWSSLGI